jgi:RHS repeat-associated protein
MIINSIASFWPSAARWFLCRLALMLALCALGPLPALAVTVPYLEGLRPVAPDEVTTLGPDLFGDRVNLFNGSLEFEQTDLQLPGNSALPVELGRRFTPARDPRIRGPLGDWDLDLPYVGGVFLAEGWTTTYENHLRCSNFSPPPHRHKEVGWVGSEPASQVPGQKPSQGHKPAETGPLPPSASPMVTSEVIAILPTDYWQGTYLSIPGQGMQELLLRNPTYAARPTGVTPYPVVTHRNWQIRCLDSVQHSPGEGFVAVSPEGVSYYFDWMVSRFQPALIKQTTVTARAEYRLYATRVEDRFGNSVRYAFDPAAPAQLKRIYSSDGREIELTWSGGLLRSATDRTRTIQYQYDSAGNLQHAVLPDNTRWTFNLSGMRYPYVDDIGESATCEFPGVMPSGELRGSMIHPSGTEGRFDTAYLFHGRTGVLRACYYVPRSNTLTTGAVFPRRSIGQSLIRKTLSNDNMESQVWEYSYGDGSSAWSTCTGCAQTKPVRVKNPDGHVTRMLYGIWWQKNEGQLLQQDEGFKADGSATRRTLFRYRDYATGARYPEQFGRSIVWNGDYLASRHRPMDRKIVEQEGSRFTWQVADGSIGFDGFVRPEQVHKFRGLGNGTANGAGQADRRIELVSYFDHLSAWVLGQTRRLVDGSSGLVVNETAYDSASALPVSESRLGRLEATYEYHPDGTLKAHFDAGGRGTWFSNYHRGAPREVLHADGSKERQDLNNLGKPLWIENEVGSLHRYTWDASGRLIRVEYPTGDAVPYHPTVVSLTRSSSGAYGLPAGHWLQVSTTGNARTERYFDALLRERLRVSFDTSDPIQTRRAIETRYDRGNRKAWQSYPVRSFETVGNLSTAGIATSFDALGRPTLQTAHSELGNLETRTEYLADFRKRVTNPRGFATVFSYQAFDTPSDDTIRQISLPEAVTVDILRDAFGKATSITRGGPWGSGTQAVTRKYVYDKHHRLCKTIEPESGATVQQYDASGNLAWRASGLNLPSTDCDWDSVPAARRIQFAYDFRDRLTQTTHGDGSGSITRDYFPDGELKTLTAARPGTNTITWAYQYNKRRLLTQERYEWGDSSHRWIFNHGIEAHGHVSSLQDPWGLIDYAPNALGQPTRAGGYAHSVKYHPNGMVESYTLGNWKTYVATLNDRGLPASVVHSGILSDRYSYDANGNVTQIVDDRLGLHRSMPHYDGLDRLRRADGPWGIGQYTYDPIDNLVSSTVGTRTLQHRFDPSTNRMTALEGSINLAIGYDANGNVASRGSQIFSFDIANRMLNAHGKASYVYDGHGRRNLTWFSDGTHRHEAYTRDGKMRFNARMGHGTRRFVYLADKLIAEVADGGVTTYKHTDGLGSPVATTNSAGTELETQRTRYEPYGGTVVGSPTPYGIGFTGHVNDADTGLVYMQQRYYDPIAGRFLSVDPVTTDAKTGSSFNRYVYGNNNPYKFKDPDGRFAQFAFLATPPGLAVAAVAVVGHYLLPGREAREQSLGNLIRSESSGGGKPSTLTPGPNAGDSIPARGPGRDFTPGERQQVNDIGNATGCHTCGAKSPGTKENWIPDHQPPNSQNPDGGPQRLYPHCLTCSRTQGGEANAEKARGGKAEEPKREEPKTTK